MRASAYLISIVAIVAMAAIGLAAVSPGADAAPTSCGPGSHWIDSCFDGGGSIDDDFPSSGAIVGLDYDGNCAVDENIVLSGPTTVTRQDAVDESANFPGEFGHSTDGHKDAIDTEIVSMELVGTSPVLGPIKLKVGTTTPAINPAVPPTKGTIIERPTNSSRGNSFFDVFFEIDLQTPPSGFPPAVYNHTELRVTAVIKEVKPNTSYIHPVTCKDLFTAPVGGVDTGVNLVTARHCTTGCTVGGTVDVFDETEARAESASGGAPPGDYAGPIAAAVGAMLALGASGWYLRRRWLR